MSVFIVSIFFCFILVILEFIVSKVNLVSVWIYVFFFSWGRGERENCIYMVENIVYWFLI